MLHIVRVTLVLHHTAYHLRMGVYLIVNLHATSAVQYIIVSLLDVLLLEEETLALNDHHTLCLCRMVVLGVGLDVEEAPSTTVCRGQGRISLA